MSPDELAAFKLWHDSVKHMIFKIMEEVRRYTIADVTLLRLAVYKFADMLMLETGISVFQHSMTIAASCMLAFRKMFLKSGTLQHISENGYIGRGKHSEIAIKWLTLIEKRYNIVIRKANSANGEKSLSLNGNTVLVDGCVEDTVGNVKHIFEFLG